MTVLNPIPNHISAFGGGPDTGQNDLIPALHLWRLATPGIKTVCIIGDSTGVDTLGPSLYDPTQCIWGALKAEFLRRNPNVRFNFVNRAIAGSNWGNPVQTGTAMNNPNIPAWFTDYSKVWLDYVQAVLPDVLCWVHGTNYPDAGQVGGSGVAVFINQCFTYINNWPKIQHIILLTNKVANPGAGSSFVPTQEAYKAVAAFQRTFARSGGRGYAAFPRIGPVGLIDLGRQYMARALGKDPAHQYMSRVPGSIVNGLSLSATPVTLGTTTDGDLSLTLVFPGGGAGAMYAAGIFGITVNCTNFISNRLHFVLGNTGNWITNYQLVGSDADPVLAGQTYTPPAGDVTLAIILKNDTIRVSINGNYVIDTSAPRLIANCAVSITATAPVGNSFPFNVTEFLEGIGAPVLQTLDPLSAFGADNGPTAGNNSVHLSSTTVALIDYQTIATTNLSAPQPTAAQTKEDDSVQIYVDISSSPNTANASEEAIKTAPILPNQLKNIGDVLEIEAWGTMAATTDSKSIRLRFGGLTGLDGQTVVLNTTLSAAGTTWFAKGTVAKSGNNTQSLSGFSNIATVNYNTFYTTYGQNDTVPTYVAVCAKNNTTPTAASITCTGLRVSYVRAPGT
jgi:hypothetical protein